MSDKENEDYYNSEQYFIDQEWERMTDQERGYHIEDVVNGYGYYDEYGKFHHYGIEYI